MGPLSGWGPGKNAPVAPPCGAALITGEVQVGLWKLLLCKKNTSDIKLTIIYEIKYGSDL